tara:strand:+ start:2267 stop:3277 length:1011 start_codon:yes stop_codon:yes gene_type:complete
MKQHLKIGYFTEGRYSGKIPADHPNMRVDLAWIHHLNATHHSLYDLSTIGEDQYDIALIVMPKNKPEDVSKVLPTITKVAHKIGFVQEGPCDYWTDYTLFDQLEFLNTMDQADFLMCHNKSDQKYYNGVFPDIDTYVLPSVLVHEAIPVADPELIGTLPAIIGGNMCKWYNGMVSLMVATDYTETGPIYIPSMGRKIPGEERLGRLSHLPYMQWSTWMKTLSQFKVGVHLMPTIAAGTFALNTSYWGIPTIGYNKVDTQRICQPRLSVDVDDIASARKLALQLRNDQSFYDECAKDALDNYAKYYHPDIFNTYMRQIIRQILDIEYIDENCDITLI